MHKIRRRLQQGRMAVCANQDGLRIANTTYLISVKQVIFLPLLRDVFNLLSAYINDPASNRFKEASRVLV